MLFRSALIALNKVELTDEDLAVMVVDELAQFGLPVVQVSAKGGEGLAELREAVFQMLPDRELWAQNNALEIESDTVREEPLRIEFRIDPAAKGVGIINDGQPERVWSVHGGGFEERIVRFSRFMDEAAEYLGNLFKRQGLYNALKRAGAREGDTVEIGAFRFEYFDDEEQR